MNGMMVSGVCVQVSLARRQPNLSDTQTHGKTELWSSRGIYNLFSVLGDGFISSSYRQSGERAQRFVLSTTMNPSSNLVHVRAWAEICRSQSDSEDFSPGTRVLPPQQKSTPSLFLLAVVLCSEIIYGSYRSCQCL